VVGTWVHAVYLQREVVGGIPHTLLQPSNKGTAPGILWPTHWVSWRAPEAVVAVFPSDHFVDQERAFLAYVGRAIQIVRQRPELVVLLGMDPDSAEEDYGWIEPGDPVAGAAGCFRVRSFWEKPTRARAEMFLRAGFLWNSFILVARAGALKALGRRHVPDVDTRLSRIEAFAGSEHEAWAVQQAYRLMPGSNFSRDVLARCADSLAVLPVQGVLWCDWGSPERVVKTLSRINVSPPWLKAWQARPA
jgi:mannose-1-phosphate guanylyltransferase